MRLLLLVVTLSVLSAGSFWALTDGPLAPPPPGDSVTEIDVAAERSEEAVSESVVSESATPPSSRASELASDLSRGVRVQYSTELYAVNGTTPQAILRSLVENGPRSEGTTFFGLTQVEVGLFYQPADVLDDCVIGDVNIALNVTVTLPDWTPPADADRGLVQEWGQFHRALSGHEAQHRTIAEDGAEHLYRQLIGLRRTTCAEVEAEARQRMQRSEIAIESAHRRFDAETGHGQTEGAVWPVAGD